VGDLKLLTKRISSPDEAAKIIRAGGLVAFPTETVFGVGVDATNSAAVKKLFAAKGRPSNNPLIVHVSANEKWSQAASVLTPCAGALLKAFAPGPLTVVLPKHATISPLVSAGLETVGVRIPNHSVALQILRQADVPVAAPSANRSGRPSCTTWKAVLEDLDGRIDAVYCENADCIGIESTVVDCCGEVPVVLRPGAVTIEHVRQVVSEAQELAGGVHQLIAANAGSIRSPGLLHPHYQPRAKVRLVRRPISHVAARCNEAAYCGMTRFAGVEDLALFAVFTTIEEYAAAFYEFLREVDRQSLSTVFVEEAPNTGIGKALLDRQRRASAS